MDYAGRAQTGGYKGQGLITKNLLLFAVMLFTQFSLSWSLRLSRVVTTVCILNPPKSKAPVLRIIIEEFLMWVLVFTIRRYNYQLLTVLHISSEPACGQQPARPIFTSLATTKITTVRTPFCKRYSEIHLSNNDNS